MENSELEKKYNHLVTKVRVMLDAQKAYFKTRDMQKLKQAKALEKEVDELINPPPIRQADIDWLAK